MTIHDVGGALSATQLFAGVDGGDLARVEALADEIEVAAGHVLTREGETGRHAFVLLAGSAEIRRQGSIIGTARPGALFGDIALLDFGPHWSTVVAETDATVLVLGPTAFRAVLELPVVAQRILREQVRRLRSET